MRRQIEPICRPLLLVILLAAPSCQDPQHLNVAPLSLPSNLKTGVQEGEVTLQDGDDTKVVFAKPYASPPRLTLVEFKRAEFYKQRFSMSDFEIVEQTATFFRIRSNHAERGTGSWATIKWRAEGTLAVVKPVATATAQVSKTAQEQMVERFKKAGGKVDLDPPVPGGLVVRVDLHHTAVTDADLEPLEGLKSVRALNLYGTPVTDAGVKHLSGLTDLRILYLNDTHVTDAALQSLQELIHLNELDLAGTGVTDAGLVYLKDMTELHDLTLGGSQITDAGLAHLKGLRNLKHLYLVHTSVTAAGIQELKKALPGVHLIQ
jgi:hypothetical protein